MLALINLYDGIVTGLRRQSDWLLPTLARFVFAAVLLNYFLKSGFSKLEGLFSPSFGSYYQIFPKAIEAAGGDISQLGLFHKLVILAGSYAEIVLPILIVVGLFTRLASLGMIGFVIVQSLTDIYGHMLDDKTIGAWFDAGSGSLIMDQRAFWIMALILLIIKGAGPLSVDRLLVGSGLIRGGGDDR